MTFSSETLDRYFISMTGDMKLCVYDKWHTVPLNSETLALKEALDNKWRFVVTLSDDNNIVDLRVVKTPPDEFMKQITEIRETLGKNNE